MSSVVIAGNTSGTITLDAPNVAGTTVLTLPTANGTILTTASTLASPSVSGNLTMTTGGITFNANPGGGTQATLDDYEVGTWTPTIAFGGASVGITYTIRNGAYVKVGKVVHIRAYIALSSKGSSLLDKAI